MSDIIPPLRPPFETVDIPTDLEALLGFTARCGCGRVHAVDLKRASVRRGAIDDVVPFVREIGSGLSIAVVTDRTIEKVAGETAARRLSAAGHSASLVVLPDGAGGRPHADEPTLRRVEDALEGMDLAVAVGSGTINDLTKLASFKRGIPYIVIATAPSMNGYTSAIAAVMMRGVKRTVACHQPYAGVADLDILKTAPLELCWAGLGDLESKPTASADFRLSSLLRGTYFCSVPERVVLAAEARAAAMAGGLKERDPDAVEALTRALILSGLSMKLAGSSSPASGGEHLISHFWDMNAAREGRVEGWHGAQVGVATIVTATLYHHLRHLPVDGLDVDSIMESRERRQATEQSIRNRHGTFADEVIAEWTSKQLTTEALRAELRTVRARWSELWRDLDDTLVSPQQIRDTLKTAGAPVTVEGIGLTRAHLEAAYLTALEIRGRYTVLDFAKNLGVLDNLKDRVLQESGCL